MCMRFMMYFLDVDELLQPLVDYLNSNNSFGLIQTDVDLTVCCLNNLGKLACKFENRARSVILQNCYQKEKHTRLFKISELPNLKQTDVFTNSCCAE